MITAACNSAIGTIINLGIGALVGALGGYLRYLIKKQKNEEKVGEYLKEGMMWILHDALEPICDAVIERGFVYLDEYENLCSRFKIYEGLGGENGIKHRMVIIKMMPKKPRGTDFD